MVRTSLPALLRARPPRENHVLQAEAIRETHARRAAAGLGPGTRLVRGEGAVRSVACCARGGNQVETEYQQGE